MKKILLIIIGMIIFLGFDVSALEINSEYAVLYNLNDNQVVFDKNKDDIVSVASLTKIMTTLVAISEIDDYQEKVIMSKEMFDGLREANAYQIGLRVGQEVTYNDLLYGMFLASGADATRAIAYSVAGNENNFVELMNKKARDLNLKHTHFANTVGLDQDGHFSTVSEIAAILKVAFENEKFKEIFLTDKYTLSDNSITVVSSMKKVMNAYNINAENILGGKTGYTGNAGRCLASIAYDAKNEITYLLVTTKAVNVKEPAEDASNIYKYFFDNYGYQQLVKEGDLLIELSTKYSKTAKVSFFSDKEITKYLENDYDRSALELKYNGTNVIVPNNKVGEKLGVIDVLYEGKLVDSVDIILKNKLDFSLLNFLITNKNYCFIFVICFFIISGIIILKVKKIKKG